MNAGTASEEAGVMTEERKFNGLGVSEGSRIGKAFVYNPVTLDAVEERKTDSPDKETDRLRVAKERSLEDLEKLVEHTRQTVGEEKAVILKGQISMLADPSFYPQMEQKIAAESWAAEAAVRIVAEQTAALFESMASEYMRERAADIRDVAARLLTHLIGAGGGKLSDISEEVILIADDLSPSDTVQLNKKYVLGFVTRIGGKTSHTAILANSLGIPAVLGAGAGIDGIENGDTVAIDGGAGECVVNPSEATVAAYLAAMEAQAEEQRKLQAFADKEAITRDGFRAEIAANIGTPEEAADLVAQGAEAVGLYRTEFLFMSRSEMPDEQTQYEAYKAVTEAMQGRPVVIRTLDIGGDKELPYMDLPEEMNPFLGYRAIRLCLDRKELFMTQLRAILRASAHGKINVMFPMISGLREWREAKALFEEARASLAAEGVAMAERVGLGIMVEIPSAALQADRFAREVDFFSIGTNDLVQYTVAVDRMNERVAGLYDYFHPAVLRLIKNVIDASEVGGKWTGMCGSMAGDPLAAPLLVGLGLHEWSMAPSRMRRIKEVVTKLDRSSCQALVERVLDMDTAEEVRRELELFQAEASE
ncbi:phosphoenolpyruvate--protein phosphotransferase [Paenibacillus beijingensis]|uniref:Phosphoenolpyruvate-protein phosphotransferase n=1 Tax=Paenibacillus beijingensis TaxID=1126833 RepID=A0A0D5NGT2_9BACL|nr:phosphoenolpyruvate--protein phosphotransferase [Paenibacillus beijingensis]AJY74108.1 phosphoenolpyruvate-protein phosphotransferase [Paenibacillus beijingensis]